MVHSCRKGWLSPHTVSAQLGAGREEPEVPLSRGGPDTVQSTGWAPDLWWSPQGQLALPADEVLVIVGQDNVPHLLGLESRDVSGLLQCPGQCPTEASPPQTSAVPGGFPGRADMALPQGGEAPGLVVWACRAPCG